MLPDKEIDATRQPMFWVEGVREAGGKYESVTTYMLHCLPDAEYIAMEALSRYVATRVVKEEVIFFRRKSKSNGEERPS